MKLKNGAPRRSKSCFTIVSETYKDFANNTSIQGLKYTVKDEINTLEKVFWIIVVICGLCCATYMTMLFWERYVSNPTRTTILTSYAPTTLISFPAVTLCNINRILVSKVDNFVGNLTLNDHEKEIARKALPQLLAFNHPNSIEYNMTELEILQSILNKNKLNDISEVMRELSQNCDDMLMACVWEKEPVYCSDYFAQSLTVDGYCCSFNYGNGIKRLGMRTGYNGESSGITVLLNPMIQPVQYSSLYSSGFKVLIHAPTEYPGYQSTTKIVSVGKVSFLQTLGTKLTCSEDVESLPISQRDCLYPNEHNLISFGEYSASNCLTECAANHFYTECGCVPFYFSFLEAPICNVSNIPCLKMVKKRDAISGKSQNCDCPSQCENSFYTITTSSTQFEYNQRETVLQLSPFPVDRYSILLNVFFLSQKQTIYLRDTITSTVYLLSSFGGVYSLFMGCSLITIFEILYYCVFRFVVNMKLFGKVDTDMKEVRKEKFKRIQRKIIRNRDEYHNVFLP